MPVAAILAIGSLVALLLGYGFVALALLILAVLVAFL